MHRCYIDPSAWTPPEIAPDGEELHHLLDVLRVVDGDPVELFDGRGRVARATLHAAGRASRRAERERQARFTLDETPRTEPRDPVAIVLLQAVPKGQRLDLVVEKATELGAARVVPVLAERCVVTLDAAGRRER
jgi:16S rRNA (uracil1498-N3)-methyltransferase